jgi:NAD(P)-dependent dehydrogenase (short-subunit alcohol dehydrogenase family)
VADVNQQSAEDTAAAVRSKGGDAIAVQCDVGSAESVEALMKATVHHFGRLDVMYNNAGITTQPGQSFMDAKDQDMERLTTVNINGVIHGCQSAIRQFQAQGSGGVIVNTASVAGLIGFGGVLYGASKGAITTLTRALALEVAGNGIRVNAVCPAAMPTNFGGGALKNSEAAKQHTGALHPLGKVIEPEECAAAALFLASDLAANITGVNLPVDGGLSAGRSLTR